MSAGDECFTLGNSGISGDFKTPCYSTDCDSHLIDNKGDCGQSVKAWDDNFSERLANFMKNSKSLLENIDKKHNNVKFQNFENNITKKRSGNNEPESPTNTLIELEETLMQIDDSKLRHSQKNDNQRSSDISNKIIPTVSDQTDNELNRLSSQNMVMSSHDNIYFKPENDIYQNSNMSFHSDYNTLNSSLSFDHLDEAINYNSVQLSDINTDKNARHFRNMTYSGSTNLKSSNLSSIAAFKLALYKKRANLMRKDNKREYSDLNDYKHDQVGEKSKGFQNVIKAILYQNNDLSSQYSSNCKKLNGKSVKKTEIMDKDVNEFASPYLLNNSPNELKLSIGDCQPIDIVCKTDNSDKKYSILGEISYLFNNIAQNNKKYTDKLSLSSKNSLVESSIKMKKWSNESLPVTSSLSISNIFVNAKLDKSEKVEKVLSAESNMSLFSSTCFKYSAPMENVSETGKTSIDSNEKENISELNTHSKSSGSPPTKYIVNKNHDFKEALRIDELENEINRMKCDIKDKDKKITILETISVLPVIPTKESKITFKNTGTDACTGYKEEQLPRHEKETIDYRDIKFDQKSCDGFLINSKDGSIHDEDNNATNRIFNALHEYSSIKDYNPNNSSALRNKIKDLESQIQDLQEANENASQIMLSLKQKSLIETSNSTHAMVSELIDKNKILREEVDRLHQSIPALKGDTISSQFLRQELENLKDDLYSLKQQNNLIVMENISLKNQLKKKDNTVSLSNKYEDRYPQTNEHNKHKQSICNDTYELNNHSKDLSDSDDSICLPTNSNISNNQSKAMSMTNLGMNLSSFHCDNLQKQPKKVCKMLPQGTKKRINQISELYDNTFSESNIKMDKRRTQMTNDSTLYEKQIMDLSNDSTDSILSDANKEMEDIIFQSEVENNIQLFSTKKKYDKIFEHEYQYDKSFTKSDTKELLSDAVSQNTSKFSTLGKTAYAPRASYDINIGDVVKFIRQGGRISRGSVHYVGPLPNRKDTYLGIELEIEDGKHDGIYDGNRYFQCIKNKGVFVAFNKVIMVYSRKN